MHDLLFTRRHIQGCIERLSGVASVGEQVALLGEVFDSRHSLFELQ